MAQYNHLPVFQRAYQLALEVHQAISQFPREHKYALGQKLKDLASELLDLIVEANSREDKADTLGQAVLKLEQFRIHVRLAFDLRVLGMKRYEAFSRAAEDLSKQLSGWLQWSRSGSLKQHRKA